SASGRESKPSLRLYSPNVLGPKQPWYEAVLPTRLKPKHMSLRSIANNPAAKYNRHPEPPFVFPLEPPAEPAAQPLRGSRLHESEFPSSPLVSWLSWWLSLPAAFLRHTRTMRTAPAQASKCVFS